MNIFRQHRQRIQAERAAKQAISSSSQDTSSAKGASIYEQMLAQLAAHKGELKAIESVKAKGEKKRDFLPVYEAYVDGILAADEAVQDDVVMTIFVWALDAGEYEQGLRIADWALRHNIAPPPDFSRSVATILTEELADAALGNRDTIDSYLSYLSEAAELVNEQDMPDPVKAKLYKALGFAITREHPGNALEYFKEAVSLSPKIGVKREIETLERQLKTEASGAENSDTDTDPDSSDNETQASPGAAPAADATSDETPPEDAPADGGADGVETTADEPQ